MQMNNIRSALSSLIDTAVDVLKTDVELSFMDIRRAFDGRLYDNPTEDITVAVGVESAEVMPRETDGVQEGWTVKTRLSVDITMPVVANAVAAWDTYLLICQVLSAQSLLGGEIVASEYDTVKYDRNSRAIVSQTRFTHLLNI